jgi:hypothetical protein
MAAKMDTYANKKDGTLHAHVASWIRCLVH